MTDLCDLVYARLVDRIEADLAGATQMAFTVAAMRGGSMPELPTLEERIAELDQLLASPMFGKSETLSQAEMDLRDMLGLRGHRG